MNKESLVCFPCSNDLWLAFNHKKTNETFLVHTGDHLSKAPCVEKLKISEMVSLMANHIEHLVRCNSKFLQFADLDYEGKSPEEYCRRIL